MTVMTGSSCERLGGPRTLIALNRNRPQPARRVAPLRVADLEIDALNRRVRRGTRAIRLSPAEHVVLYTIAAGAGAVVTYREIGDALGGTELDFRNNALARHVSSLRRKLGDDARHPRYVETVGGAGFRVVFAPKE